MSIFRNKKNGLLYTIYRCSPPKMTGSWFEAFPYNWEGKSIKHFSKREISKLYDIVSKR